MPYTKFGLPGHTLPIDFAPTTYKGYGTLRSISGYVGFGRRLLPSLLSERDVRDGYSELRLTTLREFTMLQLMNEITDKQNWWIKIFDDEITGKWKSEAINSDQGVSEPMIDWVIAELRYRAPFFEKSRMYTVFEGDVVKSDDAIPEALKDALKQAVRPLEDTPIKDWHPGSDEKVLDLVHPSMYPLVYGRSRILQDEVIGLKDCISRIGHGEVLRIPSEYSTFDKKVYSDMFQWLPCDVELSSDSGCKIVSYINNLHPQKFANLYAIIEQIIDRAIPLWNVTLTPQDERYCYIRPSYVRIPYNDVDYTLPEDEPEQLPDEDEDTFSDRHSDWVIDNRRTIRPEPSSFTPPAEGSDSPMVDLRKDKQDEHGLQVIVKVANIHLTPEKPEYEGGSWHIEGQMNEHICATALYYYDSENITESRLAFRQQCGDPSVDISYEQEHHEWLSTVFGCEQDEPCVQNVGSVACKEGRLLTFPNILQHRVSPFRLKDATKPGHRKILVLFLVDPAIRIISTAHVPPQRKDWWKEELVRLDALNCLPRELQDQICDETDFPLDQKEAESLRVKLMNERKHFSAYNERLFESKPFSLCEH